MTAFHASQATGSAYRGEAAEVASLATTIKASLWTYELQHSHSWVKSALDSHLHLGLQATLTLERLADIQRARTEGASSYLIAVAATVLDAGAKLEEVASLATAIKARVRARLEARKLIERNTFYAYTGESRELEAYLAESGDVVGRLKFLRDRPIPKSLADSPDYRAERTEERLASSEVAVDAKGELVTEPGTKGPILLLDAVVAELLEELDCKEAAADVRAGELGDTPAKVWRRWIPYRLVPELHGGPEEVAKLGARADMPPAVLAVALAVLASVKAERERAKSSRPAVVRATVADVLMPVWRRQQVLPVLDDGRVVDDKGHELGRIALVSGSMTTHEDTRKGLGLFGSVTGHRLVRSLVLRSHEQQERGDPFALRVRYEGGYEGLAASLGCTTKKDASALPFMAEAGASVVWSTPYAKGLALWALSVKRGNHLRRGEVAFTLNTPLAPDYARELADEGKTSSSARIARRLVPELRLEPPTGAVRLNEAGAVWTLQRRFLLECVDRAEELAAHGAIVLTLADWRELAAEVGLPVSTVPKVLASWLEGESELAPALIAEPEPWHFVLAPAHDLEWRFLLEQGKRRAAGRENGRLAKLAKLAEAQPTGQAKRRGAKRTKPSE